MEEMFFSSGSLNPLVYEEIGNKHQNNNTRVFIKCSVLRHFPLHLQFQRHFLLTWCFCIFFPFLTSFSILIFALFPVDIFSFTHCKCHRKRVHTQLSACLPPGLSISVKLYLSVEDHEDLYAVCGDREALPRWVHILSQNQIGQFYLPKDAMTVQAA